MKRHGKFSQIWRVLLLALTMPLPAAAADVMIGYPARASHHVPFELALKKGFFKEEGVDARYVYMSSAVATKGLLTNDIDYSTALTSALRAAVTGAPIIGVYSMFKPEMSLIVNPRFRQITELKGKVLGVSSYGSAFDLVTRLILRHHGLDPERDATIIAVGESGQIYAALKAGAIDGGLLQSPFSIKAQIDGFRELFDGAKLIDMPFEGIAVSKRKLQQDRQQIKAVIRALERARRHYGVHREEATAFTREMLALNDQEGKRTVSKVIESLRQTGQVTDEGMKFFIDSSLERIKAKKGSVPTEQIVDWSLAREAVAELDRAERK
jgi:ABC-type nitrate/sulfonate/bicarbonate transport system substrate-binding protein